MRYRFCRKMRIAEDRVRFYGMYGMADCRPRPLNVWFLRGGWHNVLEGVAKMLNSDNKPHLSRNLVNQPKGAIFLMTPFLGFVRCYTDEAKAEKALAIAEERYERGMGIDLDLLPAEDLELAWYGAINTHLTGLLSRAICGQIPTPGLAAQKRDANEMTTSYTLTVHDYESGEQIRTATVAEWVASVRAAQRDGGTGVIQIDGRAVYVDGADDSPEAAERIAATLGISLGHECDESDPACVCDPLDDDTPPDGHAPGDGRCANRERHHICSHDLRLLEEASS